MDPVYSYLKGMMKKEKVQNKIEDRNCQSHLSGALTQLNNIGRQNEYKDVEMILNNKGRYNGNFSVETLEENFSKTKIGNETIVLQEINFGEKCACTLNPFTKTVKEEKIRGDLIQGMFLECSLPVLPKGFSYKNNLGYHLIEMISIEIGGQRINILHNEFIKHLSTISSQNQPKVSKSLFISDSNKTLEKWSQFGNSNGSVNLMIPIPMFFERPLPIGNLNFHEVKIIVKFEELKNLIFVVLEWSPVAEGLIIRNREESEKSELKLKIEKASLHVEHVYLDSLERNRILNQPHDYLVKQLQYHGSEIKPEGVVDYSIRLNYNHPVKFLMVTFDRCPKNSKEYREKFNFEYGIPELEESFETMTLTMDGVEREKPKGPLFYREYQPRKYLGLENGLPKGVYFYTFDNNPFENDTNVSLNFSRIDHVRLNFKFPEKLPDGTLYPEMIVKVYAVNVQPLRIMQGMAGLAYSK